MRFYRNEQIEVLARDRLADLEQAIGHSIIPPVPIDLLAEKVLRLDFLWEIIEELPGEMILGAIVPKKRLIVLNEARRDLFLKKPGLERSTKGHEMGHWDLFVDKATLDHPRLFQNDDDGPFALRSSGVGEVAVLSILEASFEGQELLRKMRQRADEPDEARAVNRYAAAISMPNRLLCREAEKIDRTQWRCLYDLARKFQVTISALRVRLEQMDLLYVTPDGKLFESRDAAQGQMGFSF